MSPKSLRLADVRSLQEQIDDGKITIETLELRLENAQAEVTAIQAVAASLQDRLDDLVTNNSTMEEKKAALERSIAALQDEIANRSTDSEARERDEQLFDYKERLAGLHQTIEAERDQHQTQLASIQISRTQAIATRDRRITELEQSVAKVAASNDVHTTIQRLRADRASALEELQKVQVELRQANVASGVLNTEVDNARLQLAVSSGKLETALASLAKVSSENLDLGGEAAILKIELESSKAKLAEVEARVNELTHRLQESASHDDAEAERSQAKLILDLVLERDMSLQKVNDLTEALDSERAAKADLDACIKDLQTKLAYPTPAEDESSVAFALVRRLKVEHEDQMKRRNGK